MLTSLSPPAEAGGHLAARAALLELWVAVNALLSCADLPEVLLEVFSWTGADRAFVLVTDGGARLSDLHVTIAALLVAHGCNAGYTSVLGGWARRSKGGCPMSTRRICAWRPTG